MMQYFKVTGATGKFIEYDDATNQARIYLKTELIELRDALQARIKEADPNQPKTNAEWIAWAKAHYPYVDHSAEQIELDRILAIIEAIKDL